MIIQMIPKKVTYNAVADLRVVAERGSDPILYKMVASGFDAIEMPVCAEVMRQKARHYEELNSAYKK